MIHAQNTVKRAAIHPVSINTGAATSNVIDTRPSGLAYDYLEVVVVFGAVGGAATVLKLAEADASSDATTLTSASDIAGTVSSGSTGNLRLPQTADDDGIFRVYSIDLRKARKRYIQVQATVGATTLIQSTAILSRAYKTPEGLTDTGAATVVYA